MCPRVPDNSLIWGRQPKPKERYLKFILCLVWFPWLSNIHMIWRQYHSLKLLKAQPHCFLNCYRITESHGLERTSKDHGSNRPANVNSAEKCPGRFWISKEGDSTAPVGSFFLVLCHPYSKNCCSCLYGTSCASVCPQCSLFCQWVPLRGAWPHYLDSQVNTVRSGKTWADWEKKTAEAHHREEQMVLSASN